MEIDENITLKEARALVRQHVEEGIDCPCCGLFAKLYPYKLNANACVSLIWIYQLGLSELGGWVHVQKKFTAVYGRNATAMSYILLKHWGFIVAKPGNLDPSKKASGYWGITDKGIRFMHNEISVKSTAMVYKDKARQFRGDPINIKEALKVKFDYSELMGEHLKESRQEALL